MKKILTFATLLVALAGAASAAPYILPAPAAGALTPYDWQPVYSLEGLYSLAGDSDHPDMPGVRGSLSLYSNAESSVRHQFNINAAFMAGDKSYPFFFQDEENEILVERTCKVDAMVIPVTLGYNLNLGLSENIFFYLGGKAGYAMVDIRVKSEEGKARHFAGAFTYSAGAGLMIQCSPVIYVKAGYEYGCTYADISVAGKSHFNYGAHTFHLGAGCTF